MHLSGDVRVGDGLDGIYVVARDKLESQRLYSEIKSISGNLPGIRRSASGIFVPVAAAKPLKTAKNISLRWTVEADLFLQNRERASQTYPGLYRNLMRLKDGSIDQAKAAIIDSQGLDILDDHQVVNVAAMTMPKGFGMCLFDEQGAGKTVTLIFAFDLLVDRDEADRLIVIAPKSMVPEWPKDFSRFRGDLYKTAIVSGSAREKRRVLQENADVLVTNFETAISMEAELTALVRSRPGRTILAIDESFFIKSLDAQRTRAIRRLREWCGRAYVLCGTPAPNAPHDLVQQFSLVDFGLAFDGVELPKDRAEALPVVQSVIDSRGIYLRHLKAQVLPGLPDKRFQRVYVPMSEMQQSIYSSTLNSLIADTEAASDQDFGRNYSNFLARRAALLQICSNPSAVDSSYSEVPAKLIALDGLLENLIEKAGEKVLIWSFYTKSITTMMERYAKYGALRYDGQVTDVAARRLAVKQFQEDDTSKVLIANPAAAGAGLTLHRARFAIYESFSNQAAHYLQSLDRIHRRGQTREVEYIMLLCDKTIEIAEYNRLIQKELAAQSLLSDIVDQPVTRESFLTEAHAAAAALASP